MIATPNRRHSEAARHERFHRNVPTRYLSFGQSYSNCCKALLQSLQSNDYAPARTDQWRWRGPCGLLASKPLKLDPGRFCQHDRDTLLRHLRGSPRGGLSQAGQSFLISSTLNSRAKGTSNNYVQISISYGHAKPSDDGTPRAKIIESSRPE